MLIGITGTDGAGKGAVVNYLIKEKGFSHYSSRAFIMKEIERRCLTPDRVMLRQVANKIRKEFGNDVIVKKGIEAMKKDKVTHAVIESIRTVAEAETLKKHDGILLAVDADQKLRYERIISRGSETDHISFEEFVRLEDVEMNDPDPHGMQKAKVISMADYTIFNDNHLEILHFELEKVLKKIKNNPPH